MPCVATVDAPLVRSNRRRTPQFVVTLADFEGPAALDASQRFVELRLELTR